MSHRRSTASIQGRGTDQPIAYAAGRPERPGGVSPSGRLAEQLLDETTDLVCAATPEGRITYVNRAWQQALGYTGEEAATLRAVDLVAPEDRPRYVDTARRLVRGEPVEAFEAALVARDGRRVVCRGRAVAEMVDTPEGPVCVATRAVYRDVTAERDGEMRFRAIFDHAAVGVSVIDGSGVILAANAAFHAFLGYAAGELVGRYAPALSPAGDGAITRRPVADLQAGRVREVTVEKRFFRRDGEVRWASLTLARFPLPGGATGILGTTVDITERRRAEAALRGSDAEHRALLATLPLVVYRMRAEPPHGPLYVSPGVETLGFEHAAWMARPDAWVGALHPDDRARVLDDLAAGIAAGRPVEHEYRLVAPDGSVRWVHDRGELVPACDGGPDGRAGAAFWQGVLLDVTARREAEAAVRASEARLGLIYNGVSDLMILLRVERADDAADGPVVAYRCESVNDAYLALAGLPREEFVGRAVDELLSPEGAAAMMEQYGLAVATGDVLRYDEEVELSGGRVVLETTLTPILDELGVCTHLLGASRDVSARRRAEAALRASEARHRTLFERSTAIQLLVDPRERRVADANEAAARFYGYPLAQLRGKSLSELDALGGAEPAGGLADAGAEGGKAVLEHRTASGARRTVELHVTPVELDGRTFEHAIVHDVTERIAAERALRESEARVRGAVEASLDALFVCRARRDATGRIVEFDVVDCNAQAGALWGLAPQRLIGGPLTEIFPIVRQPALFDAFRHVADTGEPHVCEQEATDSQARPCWMKLQIVRVGDGVAVTMRDIGEQKQVEETLRGLALVDELTGVHNRRGFMALAEREWQRARREARGVVLAYIDLDDFKSINDTHGHAEGDRALRMVADVLRATFRGVDVIGRLGGDEFAVIVVPGGTAGTALADMRMVEGRLRERLAHHLATANAAARASGRAYDVAMSLGIACLPGGPAGDDGLVSLAGLMIEADERLYDAKRMRRA